MHESKPAMQATPPAPASRPSSGAWPLMLRTLAMLSQKDKDPALAAKVRQAQAKEG